jgi:hypothetical protein
LSGIGITLNESWVLILMKGLSSLIKINAAAPSLIVDAFAA